MTGLVFHRVLWLMLTDKVLQCWCVKCYIPLTFWTEHQMSIYTICKRWTINVSDKNPISSIFLCIVAYSWYKSRLRMLLSHALADFCMTLQQLSRKVLSCIWQSIRESVHAPGIMTSIEKCRETWRIHCKYHNTVYRLVCTASFWQWCIGLYLVGNQNASNAAWMEYIKCSYSKHFLHL